MTIGHVSASLYIGGFFFRYFVRSETISLPLMLPYAVVALFLYFMVSRTISCMIISYNNNSSFKKQLAKIFHDINWGYCNTYSTGLITAILYEAKGPWSLLLSLPLLVGTFKSVSYYSRNHILQKAVSTDALTEVENRAALESFTVYMQMHPLNGTAVMIDLDNFKKVNDEMGHAFGDTLLRQVALVLKQNIRDLDHVFRFGGDEFVLFLPHGPEDIESIQERITNLINLVYVECYKLGVSTQASVGIATIPNDTCDFKTLLAIADERMYIAKSERPN
ncbi:putative Diguanylate cyclase [Candidatus Desulfosporosinus infrequens]|uniref:Putative Diguanylate cyclase n=1 Tax=Candidatus Desulfosporosinus infrequens TaxID=2043169 RepID=A0A2U3KY89_9FIRM|nr:putative Diguanylate cyclase [Candidatus Desulfosporosinus infrequens]